MTKFSVELDGVLKNLRSIPPDFTIKTNNGDHKCHRLLAASFSGTILNHAKSMPDSNFIEINFPDPLNQFELITNIFYGEQIEITPDNIYFLAAAAFKLRISRLINAIREIDPPTAEGTPIEFDIDDPFNGVFSFLSQINPNYMQAVTVRASTSSSYGLPENVIIQEIAGKYWESEEMRPNPYIEFDFCKMKLNLQAYSLLSTDNASDNRDPHSWIVAGSNDGENWVTIDQVDNKSDLYGPNMTGVFECLEKENNDPYAIIRFEMTEPNFRGDWTFRLARVEFFGDLFEEILPKKEQPPAPQFQIIIKKKKKGKKGKKEKKEKHQASEESKETEDSY
ncbi:hypothetical protein TRFO_28316 [Tritrichomonas foetus]|uniref:F5/8 type C domain containing protein n=1 Tax=Tritrichomonas foetus TaxID=1144522 RepID=A0A1J4K400_9EUKA|nr:hypothetical protein TRFO_28316 [Tritrichomonas foetus]|eukprot:OHT04213.1 hypothetical protein TRFO_28316 [Tritrichomonas foetus]